MGIEDKVERAGAHIKSSAGETGFAADALVKLTHALGPDCWCQPEVHFKDPETGAIVYLHRRPQ